ncbi:MAG: M20/M25/M40 family metallo-hydrolase [bacterium]|nr:M20/M25/M40 family metallo-hydrolase [bacterium]
MLRRSLVAICLFACSSLASADGRVRHEMTIELDPVSHRIEVTDRMTLPVVPEGEVIEFLLNSALEIRQSDPPVSEVPLGDVDDFFGINASPEEDRAPLTRYRVSAVPEGGALVFSYEGVFDFGLSDEKEQYTRGFRATVGQLGEEGVFLGGSSFWYPYFDEGLVEFQLSLDLPAGWHVISQGEGTSRDEEGSARWDSQGPMDEIYLTGGPLEVYREAAGAVEALVYLHEKDDSLAGKYLAATAQYIEMYRDLVGPYPYGKFALVENFWETGYGMPSFTLLGPTVIRFPFILHSSYPHEILHNWWGNSVFVDYETGNWCEGLTAYMADHLIKEQRGQGEGYRRDALQKYRDYVKEGRDFPLTEFRARHSSATEAVGYGKTLMVFHMLRRQVGDDAFRRTLARFYRGFRGKKASFADLRTSFESVTGEDLGGFFEDWVTRPGAPALGVSVSAVREEPDGYSVTGTLTQTQGGRPFEIGVPVAVHTATGTETSLVRLTGNSQTFEIETDAEPLVLEVDPQFDLFRQLDPRETPPSIGRIFGEPEILAILPADAPAAAVEQYRELMAGWQSEGHTIEVKLDSEVAELPEDRSIWVLGASNRFADPLFVQDRPEGLSVSRDKVSFGEDSAPLDGHTVVAIRRHPDHLEKAIGWLIVEPEAAFSGMGRKLPHYGKYSYLAFEGDEPTNVVKGQWPASSSPLRLDLRPADRRSEPLAALSLEKRTALAELPPVFSLRALMEHVTFLASPELEGRGVGGDGLRRAAEYIAERFEAVGLTPGGGDGTWFQGVEVPSGPDGEPVEVVNVVGYLEGANADWADQSVVVGAHYDHLGRGWPDVHQGDEGAIHPGADDNASGVAVLLELAANLAAGDRPARSLVFVAFAAEEAGRHGSRHHVEQGAPFPTAGIRSVINLDTVGRLFDQKVSILGTGTADEWQHIFRGSSFVTGVESRNVPHSAEASDQMSFIDKGIPGVQIFTQAHGDYHRPGDTAEKVDGPGLVKVATLVKEAVAYLAEREDPLTVTIDSTAVETAPDSGAAAPSGRKVRFGTIPDFAFQGPGARIDSVAPGSPAEKAGLRQGDILVRIGERQIGSLQDFSEALKALGAGETVRATVLREGEEITVPVTVEAR